MRLGTPQDSLWWVNYAVFPSGLLIICQKMNFKRRYRISYESWKDFVEKVDDSHILKRWRCGATDVAGRLASPLELLSLGALKYLGRKFTFDDLEEITFISERTRGRFFE